MRACMCACAHCGIVSSFIIFIDYESRRVSRTSYALPSRATSQAGPTSVSISMTTSPKMESDNTSTNKLYAESPKKERDDTSPKEERDDTSSKPTSTDKTTPKEASDDVATPKSLPAKGPLASLALDDKPVRKSLPVPKSVLSDSPSRKSLPVLPPKGESSTDVAAAAKSDDTPKSESEESGEKTEEKSASEDKPKSSDDEKKSGDKSDDEAPKSDETPKSDDTPKSDIPKSDDTPKYDDTHQVGESSKRKSVVADRKSAVVKGEDIQVVNVDDIMLPFEQYVVLVYVWCVRVADNSMKEKLSIWIAAW